MREVASAEKAIDVEQMQVSGSPCHVSMFIMMACVAKATPFWPQSSIAPLLPNDLSFPYDQTQCCSACWQHACDSLACASCFHVFPDIFAPQQNHAVAVWVRGRL